MIRLATLTKRAAAAVALSALLGAPAAARADRTDTNDKPVIIIAGPEVPATCSVLEPLRTAIRRETGWSGTKKGPFSGSIHIVGLNGHSGTCTEDDGTAIKANSLYDAALAFSHTIAGIQDQAKGPVDVVTLGSAGPALRYALLMSARKRAGLMSFGADKFDAALDVEDVVAMGGLMNGTAVDPVGSDCNPFSFCHDLVRPANPTDPKPIQWQLMDSKEQDGTNPQGVNGTDWSVIALAGDRYAPADSVLGMDAAHKAIYEDEQLTLRKALTDDANTPQPVRYLHAPVTDLMETKKSAGPLKRIAQDLIYGTYGNDIAQGPAGATGCVGYNESSTGETIMTKPDLAAWKGDARAVRVLKFATVEAVADCFKVDPKDKDVYVAQGTGWVRVNGLDIHLFAAGSKLKFDVKKRHVWLDSGTANLELPIARGVSSIPLGSYTPQDFITLDWKFPASDGVVQTDDGTALSLQSPKGKLLGLEMQGGITFKTVKGAFQLDLTLGLPAVFSTDLAGRPGVPPECNNQIDDDGDNKIDAKDEGCGGTTLGDVEDNSKSSGFAITVGTRNATGLQIDKVAGNVGGSLRFGPFRTDGAIGFEYNRADDELKFNLEVRAPAMSSAGFKLKVGFKGGSLSSIYAELNGLEVPLWSSGWFLQRAGIGVNGLEPGKQFELLISVTASFFRRIDNTMVMSVDGEATTTFTAPWKLKLTGGWNVVESRVGTASFEFEQGVGGKLNVTLGKEWGFMKDAKGEPKLVLIPTGTLAGQMSNAGEFDLGAVVQACIKGSLPWKKYEEPWCLGKTDMRLTRYKGQPVTQALCFKTSILTGQDFSVGFVNKIGTNSAGHLEITTDWIKSACDVADYGAKPSAVGDAPTDRFTIRPGTDRQVVTIHGPAEGQAPQVTLIAPDGTRIATPTDAMGGRVGDSAFVLTGMGDQTVFALGRPQAGEWRVETADGSPSVSKIDVLAVLPEPEVRAAVVRGRSGGFTLRHHVKAEPGQRVRFVERAGGVFHELAVSEGGGGRSSFAPAFGPAGRRDIVAVVMQDGRVRRELTVASYVAPAPAPAGRVRGIVLRRTGQRVAVTWRPAAHAGKYEVVVRLPGGATQAQIVSRRRVVIDGVVAAGRLDVRIRALRVQDEMPGAPVTAHGTGLKRAHARQISRRH